MWSTVLFPYFYFDLNCWYLFWFTTASLLILFDCGFPVAYYDISLWGCEASGGSRSVMVAVEIVMYTGKAACVRIRCMEGAIEVVYMPGGEVACGCSHIDRWVTRQQGWSFSLLAGGLVLSVECKLKVVCCNCRMYFHCIYKESSNIKFPY